MPIHTRTTITTRYDSATELTNDVSNIIARARARDASFMNQFLFAKIGDDSVRAQILGLYSGHNENGYKYLIEVATADLAFIWEDYLSDMQNLDADHTTTLAELWLKEHMAEVDDAIVRNKFITMQQKNEELDAYYQARISALDVDRAALETKRRELEYLKNQIANQIQRTLIQIQKEEIEKNLVQIEVLNKQLAVQRERQRYIDIGIDVTEYQQKLTSAGYELALLDSEFNKFALENRKLDLKESALSVQNLKYAAQLIRLHAELDAAGLRLYRADTESMENDTKSRRIDLDLIQEQLRKLKLETVSLQLDARDAKLDGMELKIEADIQQAQARGIELDARSTGMDADAYSLDARETKIRNAIEKINVDLAGQELRLDRIAGDRMKIKLRSGRVDVRETELASETVSMEARKAKMLAAIDRIQTELAKVGLRIIQADTEIVRLNARETELDTQIEKINTALLAEGVKLVRIEGDSLRVQAEQEKLESYNIEKQITEERYGNKVYESTTLHDAKVDLLMAELNNIAQDSEFNLKRLEKMVELTEARKREIFESFAASVTGTYNSLIESRNRKDTNESHNTRKLAFAREIEIALGNEMDEEQRKLISARYDAVHLGVDYQIARAKLLAKAEISNTLTHLLGVQE